VSKKHLYIFIFSIIYLNVIHSQESLNSTSFLQEIVQQIEKKTARSFYQNSNKLELKIPVFDQIEFRTDTDDFRFSKQRYTLRVNPTNRKVYRLQSELYRLQKDELQLATAEGNDQILPDAYHHYIDIFFAGRELNVQRKLHSIHRDKLIVLEKQSLLPNFDVKDLLSAMDNLQQVEYNIQELVNEKQLNGQGMQTMIGGGEVALTDEEQLININHIQAFILETNKPFPKHKQPNIAILEAKQDMLKTELEIEKMEEKKYFDFLQFRYQGPHDDPFGERLSMGIGLRIPTKSNLFRTKELELELLKEEQQLTRDIQERKNLSTEIQQELQALITQYFFLLMQIESATETYEKVTHHYSQSANTSPLIQLKIKELELEKEVQKLRLERDIYKSFINWLKWSGKLYARPYINYLSDDLPVMSKRF